MKMGNIFEYISNIFGKKPEPTTDLRSTIDYINKYYSDNIYPYKKPFEYEIHIDKGDGEIYEIDGYILCFHSRSNNSIWITLKTDERVSAYKLKRLNQLLLDFDDMNLIYTFDNFNENIFEEYNFYEVEYKKRYDVDLI